MPVCVFNPDEIPDRTYGRKPKHDDEEYLTALAEGQPVGDSQAYRSSGEARRECVRVYSRVARKRERSGLQRPEQRVWQTSDGAWMWALPSPRE
jgi:hypothetical protein